MSTTAFSGMSNGTTVPGLMTPTAGMASATQQFCLKWNNHTANMVKTFGDMLAGESFTDVTLACDGLMIKAHKIVLSACSNYFRELFIATPCKHPIVVLKDMKIDDLRAIIDFMYRGEVNVSQNQLGNLLKTAEVLRVKGLTEVNDADGMKSDADGSFHMNSTSVNSMDSHSSAKLGTISSNGLSTTPTPHSDMSNMQPSAMNQSVDGMVSPSGSPPGSRRRKRRNNDNGSNGRISGSNNLQTVTSTAGMQHQEKEGSADMEEDDILGSQSDGESMGQSSGDESIDVSKGNKRITTQTETRESIIANSFTSIASTSSSSSSHAQNVPQLQGPLPVSSHVMDQSPNPTVVQARGVRRVLSHAQSSQREVVSTDTSLADGVSNDVSDCHNFTELHMLTIAFSPGQHRATIPWRWLCEDRWTMIQSQMLMIRDRLSTLRTEVKVVDRLT